VEGVLTAPAQEGAAGSDDQGFPAGVRLELQFPENIVGTGELEPPNWSIDLTWEP